MFDTYSKSKSNHEFNFDINAVSGTIRKSHPKSIICKVSENPYLLDIDNPRTKDKEKVWNNGHRYEQGHYEEIAGYCEVVVLQVLIIKDGFIVEFVKKEDWEVEQKQEKTV